MKWNYKLITTAVITVFGFATFANAAPITGELNINGSVLVSAFTINWIPPGPGATESGFGSFGTVLPGTGYFAGITSNPPCPPGNCYFGDSRDITRNPALAGAPPNPAFAPVGVVGAPLVQGFLRNFSAPGYAGLTFDLTLILQSIAPVCDGSGTQAVCRPDASSPFTFTRLAAGTAVAFELRGNMVDSNIASSTAPYIGRYTTQVQQSIEQILQTVSAPGGTVTGSYSANFNPVPEPGTVGLALMGVAMIATGLYRRQR